MLFLVTISRNSNVFKDKSMLFFDFCLYLCKKKNI